MKRITVVAAGLAALSGTAPLDTGVNANDAADASDRVADSAGGNADARESSPAGASEQADRGPSADLPEQVPDHVSQIHDLIRKHLSGDLAGSLGETISGVTPSDDADETAGNATDAGSDSDGAAHSGNGTNA